MKHNRKKPRQLGRQIDLFEGTTGKTRAPAIRAFLGDELIADSFAGGGGASSGIARALGRDPDIAINHDAEAIAMHAANHPNTVHFTESVWEVDPRVATRGKPVALAWFSPDCKHFSKSKGGKPLDQKVRGLAWSAVRWATLAPPRVIALENVEEFTTWGPLHRTHVDGCKGGTPKIDGKTKRPSKTDFHPCAKTCRFNRPILSRRGETFRAFVRKLESKGYVVEWKLLRACDYGAPTTRRRLFLLARRDGKPIVWPVPSHGPTLEQKHRSAAEIIDWSVPCRSIFDRKKSLSPKTEARIARGIRKFVLECVKPFIVPTTQHGGIAPMVMKAKTHGGGGNDAKSAADSLGTITTSKRGEFAIAAPVLVSVNHGGDSPGDNDRRLHDLIEPLPTVVASGGQYALAVPYLVHRSNGERPGQAPRIYDVQKPLGTVVAQGQKHSYCEAQLVSARKVAAFIQKHHNGHESAAGGQAAERPLDTIASRNTKSIVAAHLMKLHGSEESHLTSSSSSMLEPVPTITAGGWKMAQVAAFLVKYNSNGDAESAEEPLSTLTTKPRYGLVTVVIDGEEFVIVDILMRMLTPRELFSAQGFTADYQIVPTGPKGKPLTKTAQIRMAGNSVPPPMSEAIARANLPELARIAA